MVYDAETTASRAEADQVNDPGYCLQQCRIWAGIGALYPDAATAWRNTNHRHPGDRNPPRGAPVYWTGGSAGYGHIAISLGEGRVRSTDAGGTGKVATRDLAWFDTHWPSLDYAGWAEDINEVTIPDIGDDMALSDDDVQRIAKRVNQTLGDYTADGDPRQGTDGDQADKRLRQIENRIDTLLQKVQTLVDRG
jgi:hypothetical protein